MQFEMMRNGNHITVSEAMRGTLEVESEKPENDAEAEKYEERMQRKQDRREKHSTNYNVKSDEKKNS